MPWTKSFKGMKIRQLKSFAFKGVHEVYSLRPTQDVVNKQK